MKVTVRLYGHFRKFGDSLALELPAGSCVCDLERVFTESIARRDPGFYDNQGLRASRFCDDSMILPPDHPLAEGGAFSILPPVSGG
jgi:molybdopterin converting factor small subunit